MLSRRSFLISAVSIALAQGLGGCERQEVLLRILLLQGSIPPQFLGDFRRSIKQENTANFWDWLPLINQSSVTIKPESQLKALFASLETWQKPEPEKTAFDWIPGVSQQHPAIADLITLGDGWLAKAIDKKLIQPLNLANLPTWNRLSPRWHGLVKRDDKGYPDENGKIWGAPYRWGTTLMVYRRDRFRDLGWMPRDWQDLWHEDLQGRLSMIDQSREVIGLTLKKLGYSYNEPDLHKIPNLKAELISLQKQVKFYSSNYYLQPLVLGDTWLAVGWSNDILPLLSRNPNLRAVIPQSGTSLWADLWVQPTQFLTGKNDSSLSLAQQWIDFCWQPQRVNQISLFSNGSSPLLESLPPEQVVKDVKNDPLLFVNPAIFAQSEFLFPLLPKTLKEYENLWQEIRQGKK